MTDMSVTETVSLDVLSLTNDARSTYGLRQQDYQRYREYCARRIRRVRKNTDMIQGKKRYEKKPVTPTSLVDPRSLQILLFEAERSWAYAMQLKADSQYEPRKKHHSIKRLCRAVSSANQLHELCQLESIDHQTSLETQAYALRLAAYVHFERQEWQSALDVFASSRSIYDKLAHVAVTASHATLCQAAMDEIDPNIRYCAYNLKFKGNQTDDIESLLELRKTSGGPGNDLLSAKIDLLVTERMHVKARAIHTMKWHGYSMDIHNEDLMAMIMEMQEISAKINGEVQGNGIVVDGRVDESQFAGIMAEYDKLLGLGWDAAKLSERDIKEDLVAVMKVKSSKSDMHSAMLKLIKEYVTYTRLEHTFDRDILLEQATSMRLKNLVHSSGSVEKRPSQRREELIQLDITMLQVVNEMKELDIIETDLALGHLVSSKGFFVVAQRLAHTADIYTADQKYAEALVLLNKAMEQVHLSRTSVVEFKRKIIKHDQQMAVNMTKLLDVLSQSICNRSLITKAKVYFENDDKVPYVSLSKTVQDMSIGTHKINQMGVGRAEHMKVFFQPSEGVIPVVQSIPPAFEPVSFKPMFYDLAYSGMEFPLWNISELAQGRSRMDRITQEIEGVNAVQTEDVYMESTRSDAENKSDSPYNSSEATGQGLLGMLGGLWGGRK
ncbi:signal recognition particle subunit srp68 [Batrachochytrium dendrobatidis]|nr:signal recognition particle subunit srp68 [Batrachochytrium dendrobatidis]